MEGEDKRENNKRNHLISVRTLTQRCVCMCVCACVSVCQFGRCASVNTLFRWFFSIKSMALFVYSTETGRQRETERERDKEIVEADEHKHKQRKNQLQAAGSHFICLYAFNRKLRKSLLVLFKILLLLLKL